MRIAEIEGIRGILSLVVVGGHIYYKPVFWFAGCMEVFFCISGFLITRILLENLGREGFLRRYYTRRILRIWPMYYVAMLFAFAVVFVTDGAGYERIGVSSDWLPSWQGVLTPLLFLQNLELYGDGPRLHYLLMFDHSWSVAIEEQFYLLWPLLLLFALRHLSMPMRALLAVIALGFSMLLRILFSDLGTWHFWLLGSRLDGFVFGIVLAYLERSVREGNALALDAAAMFRWLWLWPCFALVPYLANGYAGLFFEVRLFEIPRVLWKTVLDPYFNFALLGFSVLGYCVFVRRETSPLSRVLRIGGLQHLGTISYSTYLLHLPIVYCIAPFLVEAYDLPAPSSAIIGYGLSLALAHLTYRWIEWPAMQLKRRYGYTTPTPISENSPCTTPSSAPDSSTGRPSSSPAPAPASAVAPPTSSRASAPW